MKVRMYEDYNNILNPVEKQNKKSPVDLSWALEYEDWNGKTYYHGFCTKKSLGSDIRYWTLLGTVRVASNYKYHSDYWGSAETYREQAVDFVEKVIPYKNKLVYVKDENGRSITGILKGVMIDYQYNSTLKLLIEPIENI